MLKKYFDIVIHDGLYSSAGNLRFYLSQLFGSVDFQNKTMLDVGGGDGLCSFYGASKGARSVICLEPEEEGSTSGVTTKFRKVNEQLSLLNRVKLINKTFQEFDNESELFDIILLHYSINHLDEEACIRLDRDEDARQRYKKIFEKFYALAAPGAKLIITDCSRYNVFALLGLKNPTAPTIEWQKHQSPEFWAELLTEIGFCNPEIRWRSFDQLRSVGKILLCNKVAAFFLQSLFFLTMEKG
ncbi:MAG TPA: class I SAM-dependent methyltransferase [Thermodesulfovibrionia bacterium]|nr:class I SAM-dependent methyltransferase [Thermodesulfovibrionia bacterium]